MMTNSVIEKKIEGELVYITKNTDKCFRLVWRQKTKEVVMNTECKGVTRAAPGCMLFVAETKKECDAEIGRIGLIPLPAEDGE